MYRSADLTKAIKKNLSQMIEELGICIQTNLSLDVLLEPSDNRTPPNSFILYCKDHSHIIKNKPGDNSKTLSDMWDNESSEKKMIYVALSNVMVTAYKGVFTELEPWDRSASMPSFCLNQNTEVQNTNTQDNITSQPFIDEKLASYLFYYNL